jgi:hypothetical protein
MKMEREITSQRLTHKLGDFPLLGVLDSSSLTRQRNRLSLSMKESVGLKVGLKINSSSEEINAHSNKRQQESKAQKKKVIKQVTKLTEDG